MNDSAMTSVINRPLLGSYAADDCQFLLKAIEPEYRTVEEKERLIQSGQLHYSEMIQKEVAPSSVYTELFIRMTEQYKCRLAQEIMRLAWLITQKRSGDITLLSLARAGTPIGVLLQRALVTYFNRTSCHYSISIIRDRGIDSAALDYLLAQGTDPSSIVFVDGWTAKGVITRELHAAVDQYNQQRQTDISRELFVVSDIGGVADVQATFDDYTIPSGLMNSTVSGLISRSVLNHQIKPGEFHGCVRYDHLKSQDRSQWFIDQVVQQMQPGQLAPEPENTRQQRQQETKAFLDRIQQKYQVSDINRIKPGIAEATRVLLRRVPDLLILRSQDNPDTRHLECLAQEKQVPVQINADMPFGACSLIKDVMKKAD